MSIFLDFSSDLIASQMSTPRQIFQTRTDKFGAIAAIASKTGFGGFSVKNASARMFLYLNAPITPISSFSFKRVRAACVSARA